MEEAFFAALLQGDGRALDEVLADDFVLVDVMTGSEVAKPALVELVGSRQLRFEQIERGEPRLRTYGSAAVVTGTTQMRGRFGDQAWSAASRYTHVYVEQGGRWRMVSAQGTQIAAPSE